MTDEALTFSPYEPQSYHAAWSAFKKVAGSERLGRKISGAILTQHNYAQTSDEGPTLHELSEVTRTEFLHQYGFKKNGRCAATIDRAMKLAGLSFKASDLKKR